MVIYVLDVFPFSSRPAYWVMPPFAVLRPFGLEEKQLAWKYLSFLLVNSDLEDG
jgi:hypothetical protein